MTQAFGVSASLADVLANRPAADAAKAGRFFYATDTHQFFRDNGSTWDEAKPGDMLKATYDADNDGKVESADSADSAGNADTVDGSHAAAFAASNHSHAVTGDMLKATYDADNDGKVESADSADNADTVDGSHAAAFATAGHTHAGIGGDFLLMQVFS